MLINDLYLSLPSAARAANADDSEKTNAMQDKLSLPLTMNDVYKMNLLILKIDHF